MFFSVNQLELSGRFSTASQLVNPESGGGFGDQTTTTKKLLDVPKDVITELILDASGSMKAEIQHRTKLTRPSACCAPS